MDVYNQKILVLGVSKSGYSVAKYLLSKNNKCYLFEELDKPHIRKNVEELVGLGCVEITANEVDIILHKINVLVISPGVPINHFVAVKAKKLGIKIMGELEFGYNALTPRICAITGTNGKTTTTALVTMIGS